jgi:hypothetical protein
MTYNLELTDTFGGEANYSWVKRAQLDVPSGASRLILVRRAKAWAGLTGIPCEVSDHGDTILIKPRWQCVVLFVTCVR